MRRGSLLCMLVMWGTGLSEISFGASESRTDFREPRVNVRLDTTFDYTSSLHSLNHEDRRAFFNLWLVPEADWGNGITTWALAVVTQELENDQRFLISQAAVGSRIHGIEFLNHLRFSPGVTAQIPSNGDQLDRESLIFGFGLTPRLHFQFNSLNVPVINRLSGFYQLGFRRNIHGFETQTNGASNFEWALSHRWDISSDLVGPISGLMRIVWSNAWTYSGERQDNFSWMQSLIWRVHSRLLISLAHENAGNALAPNGVDSNFEIFDENASTISAAVTYSL